MFPLILTLFVDCAATLAEGAVLLHHVVNVTSDNLWVMCAMNIFALS